MTILRAGFGSRSAAYEIAKSLRFRASASPLLSRTGVAGDPKKVTLSAWVKLGRIATSAEQIFEAWSAASRFSGLRLLAVGSPFFMHKDATREIQWSSATLLRDPSAWYHLVLQMDFTQASSANAVKLFINGVQDSLSVNVASGSYAQNMNSYFNTAVSHRHGLFNGTTYTDGYRAELHFLDGILAGPEEFGKTDPVTGQWVPIEYAGAYGTNGHYLDFSDGSSTTTLGYDKSGNGRNFTVSGISLTAGVTYDWMDDTPTNNFAVLNPLDLSGNNGAVSVLGSGNLFRQSTGTPVAVDLASFKITSGKWFWEVIPIISNSTIYAAYVKTDGGVLGITANGALPAGTSGVTFTYSDNDVIGCAFDYGAKTLDVYKNGALQTTLSFTPPITEAVPGVGDGTAGNVTISAHVNFGQRPFAYAPPTGFKTLCTANLPTAAVKKGSNYFDIALAAGASIKGASEAFFANFLEWIKDRANTNNHQLIDSVRGNTAVLQSNAAADETTYSAPSGSSVGWVWRIAAGFLDVVTYTGTGVARTVAHNLGVAPAMVVVKARTTAGADQGWAVYHQSNTAAPATDYLLLNSTAATADLDTVWNDTPPTSSELTVGTNALVNTSGDDYVAYLFAEVPGFSKFGSYTGNGSAAGPFVYCGFKPKFLMIKCSSTTGDWWMYDVERSPANPANLKLLANTNGVEDVSGEDVDLLSNGFKIRSTAAGQNTNAATYIFAAFAECAQKYSNAR